MRVFRYAPMALLMVAIPDVYAAKKVSVTKVKVDGYALKVVRYDNNNIKVVKDVIIGGGPSLKLRDLMRRAVQEATACSITDEWFADAKLFGKLDCPANKREGSNG